MVDHALNNGWDNTLGGFYDEGYYLKTSRVVPLLIKVKTGGHRLKH